MAQIVAKQTYTYRGKNYRKGTVLPADVAEGLGLTGSTGSASADGAAPLSLEDEARAAMRSVVERRAAAGDPEAIEALKEMELDDRLRAEAAADEFESDLPADFPGRAALVKLEGAGGGPMHQADVDALDRDGLIALKGIAETTAAQILDRRQPAGAA